MRVTVSIIIVTYNTRDLARDCLRSLEKAGSALKKAGYSMEVIVSDNGSDDTVEMVKKEFPTVLVQKNENIGFARGNNAVSHLCKGKYILMLNPDTAVEEDTLPESIIYMEQRPDVGAMTCKIVNTSGTLDRDARRSFPTPWVAFTHFSLLDRLFPNSKLFARYWYGYLDPDKEAEVDVLEGAYCLVRRDVMDQVGWYDEAYFLNGEDIDLCWKIKEAGYKIMYYPKIHILHHKKGSKGKNQQTAKQTIIAGSDAMSIFYRKRLWTRYPQILNYSVMFGIYIIKQLRLMKFFLTYSM